MYISWVPAFWLSCTSSRSFFRRGGPLMTTSMDIHTQLGPNMAHSAQNGLVWTEPCFGHIWTVMPGPAGWITRTWPAPASSRPSDILKRNVSHSSTSRHRRSVCSVSYFIFFFVLSVQRLQSRALEPLMVVYWGFGKRLAAITTVGCPRWLRQNARGKCQRCEETK